MRRRRPASIDITLEAVTEFQVANAEFGLDGLAGGFNLPGLT